MYPSRKHSGAHCLCNVVFSFDYRLLIHLFGIFRVSQFYSTILTHPYKSLTTAWTLIHGLNLVISSKTLLTTQETVNLNLIMNLKKIKLNPFCM